MKLLAVVLFMLAVLSAPASAVVYVKWNSPGPVLDGNSWQTAYHTIQEGIDDAVLAGEEVWVAQGTYTADVQLKTGVALKGGYSGAGDERDIKGYTTTIKPVNTYVAGADGAVIDGFTIIGAYYAIYCDHTSPTITNNTILCAVQAVWLYYSNAIFTHNTVRSSDLNAVYCQYGSPLIANNLIIGNRSCGVVCDYSSSPTVINNTIALNCSTGVLNRRSSRALIVNNIIAFNVLGLCNDLDGVGVARYNCIYGNGEDFLGFSRGTTDIMADPQFMSLQCGDMHIKPTSPCVNAGENRADVTTDMDGQVRTNDGTVDVGADETYGELYDVTLRKLYVNIYAPVSRDGTSWAKPFRTITEATREVALHGAAEIWVAKGLYREWFQAESFSYIYGGFAGNETLRSQRRCRTNVTTIDATTHTTVPAVEPQALSTVDGFTVRNGKDGFYVCANASTIANNIITGSQRGGVYIVYGAGMVVSGNLISNNGQYGLYVYTSNAVATNNTIVRNPIGMYWDPQGELGTASNNIVAFNDTGMAATSQYPSMSHNCFHNTTSDYAQLFPHPTDITADPLFVDKTNDFHIRGNSPCRDAGDGAAQGIPAMDLDEQNRIEGSAIDIGVDESYGEQYPPEVVRVRPDSPNDGPGNDWDHAWHSIQKALTNVSPGEEIWVAQGQYVEKFTLPAGAVLKGGYSGVGDQRSPGQNPTIIDGGGSGVILTGGTDCVIDGLTIRNGAWGVYSTVSTTVTNCTITGCAANGIYCTGGQIYLTNNKIVGNATGAQCPSGAAHVVNNTIAGNSGVGLYTYGGQVANNIIAFNQYGYNSVGSPVLSHNNIYGNTLGDYKRAVSHPTDISLDPLFVNKTLGNYRLAFGSPCIDAADAALAPISDIELAPRPRDGNMDGVAVADIGCYEIIPSPVPTTISEAKGLPNGRYVLVAGVSTAVFADRFYVENPDTSCGIGVIGAAPSTGRVITAEGLTDIVAGERVIRAIHVLPGVTASVPNPFVLNLNGLGGGSLWLQAGVQDYRSVLDGGIWQRSSGPICYGGANNIGLLVRVVGQVTHQEAGYFYLRDGAAFDDGDPAIKGVRVDWPFAEAMPADGAVIELTAISSCITKTVDSQNILVRMLRPVSATSWRELRAP